MDLMYMSEAFAHVDARRYSYVFPDRSTYAWAPESDITVAEKHRMANRERQRRQQRNNAQPCILCLESKRRKLGNYIRQKSFEDGSIREEEEDDEAVHTLQQHAECLSPSKAKLTG